jgi:TolB-like protein/Tfp pilus assembly protein PilF
VSLFDELKRRKVFKVGAAYLVVAWLAVQVVSIAFPAFEAPPWALRAFILVAMLGFPISLLMAWAFESTPEGLRRDAATIGNKRVWAVGVALAALAIAWYFYGAPAVREATAPAAVAAAPAPPAIPRKSIAVLPFVNMSADKDNEYFSDGISEELLNALARVDGLKVAGRTSSFQYKGRNENLQAIGAALGVANVLEGSVRKQGDKVRITAQLIQASDGYHLWSQTYDGDLDDVFELQERIARSITDSLKVVLDDAQAKRLVNTGTANTQAYSLYLQATAIFNRREGRRIPEAIDLLEQATRLDPSYARAWSRLAAVHAISNNYRTIPVEQVVASVEAAANKASALDPTLGEPFAALGLIYGAQRRFADERASFERALALDPDDITTNVWYSFSLIRTGYRREGNARLDRALALDPLLPIALLWRSMEYVESGDLDQADRVLRLSADGHLMFVGLGQFRLDRARGDTPAGIQHMAEALDVFDADFPDGSNAVFADACFGDAAARTETMRRIDAYLAGKPHPVAGLVPFMLLCTQQYDRALEVIELGPTSNDALFMPGMFRTKEYPGLMEMPRFSTMLGRIGLARHWDRSGAPDACRKAADGIWRCGAAAVASR